jgi:hypothetical protein
VSRELQPGCQCLGCDGFRAPEIWCSGARHYFICAALKDALAQLAPTEFAKHTDCHDMLVLSKVVQDAAENAARNIEYLQSKETTTP